MANRRPIVLNTAGYQEYFQSADTLQVDGSISINGTSFTSVVPLTVTGPGTTDLGEAAIVGTFRADEITVDINTGDNVLITLGSDGNITASGRVNATSLDINSSTVIDGVLDEDTLVSDSDTKLATQQSIKTYVDDITKTVRFAADTGTGDIEAGSTTTDTLTIAGTVNQIDTAVTGDTITISLTSTVNLDVVTVNSLQINGTTTVDSILDEDDMVSDSATALATQQSIKAFSENYTDTQIAAIPNATQTVRGFMSAADKVKIDGIEDSATADQTGAEIKALYEQEPNAYTDTKDTKLAGIEEGATADQTADEIRTLVDSATDSNVFTDADHSKLDAIEPGATADLTGAEIKSLYEQEPSAFTDAQFTKLAGIEDAATADQDGAEIKALYEAEPNAYTDTKDTKLAGIEDAATADQTAAEIRQLVDDATDSNVFTDADHSKLDNIEPGSQVNVPHDLSYTASTRALDITNGTGTTLPEATTTEAGLISAADKTKLDSIEVGATADQTAAEIRSLVDAASDSNVFTDAEQAKLADITAQNLTDLDNLPANLANKADLINGKLDPNQVPDVAITEFIGNVAEEADLTTLSGQSGDWATVTNEGKVYIITANDGSSLSDWTALIYPATIANLSYDPATRTVISTGGTDAVLTEVVVNGNSGLMTGTQADKLNNIEAGAQVNVPTDLTYDASTRTVESSTGSNAIIPHVVSSGNSGLISGADKAKLDGIEAGATADQTKEDIDALNINADQLDGIEGSSFVRNDVFAEKVESGFTIKELGGFSVLQLNNSNGERKTHLFHSHNLDYTGLTTFDHSGPSETRKDLILYTNGNITWDTHTIWHKGNDGTGSGLDADLLDGIQGSSFLRSDASTTYNNGQLDIRSNSQNGHYWGVGLEYDNNNWRHTNDNSWGFAFRNSSGNLDIYSAEQAGTDQSVATYKTFRIGGSSELLQYNGHNVWHTGNLSPVTTDTATTINARHIFAANSVNNEDNFATTTASLGAFEIRNVGSNNDAFMTFHTSGDFATYFGLDADINDLAVGGWSMGAVKNRIWHAGNDGSGSGLDADLLDGIEGSSFVRSDANDTLTGNYIFTNASTNAKLDFTGISSADSYNYIIHAGNDHGANASHFVNGSTRAVDGGPNTYTIRNNGGSIRLGRSSRPTLLEGSGDLTFNGNKVWHSDNDGSGSLLDADLVDGIQASQFIRSDTADTVTAKTTWSVHGTDSIILNKSATTHYTGLTFSEVGDARYLFYVSNVEDGRLSLQSRKNGAGFAQVFDVGVTGDFTFRTDPIYDEGTFAKSFKTKASWTDFKRDVGFTTYYNFVHPTVTGGPTTASRYFCGIQSLLVDDTNYGWEIAGEAQGNKPADLYIRKISNGVQGGWSRIWSEAAMGSGSGLGADLLDGAQPSVAASNSTIVQRHSSGYVYANYFNTTPNDVTSGVTRVCVETGNDGFIRHGTAAALQGFVNCKTNSTTDANNVFIRNGAPTVYLRDTDANVAMLHTNNNFFYLLRGANDSTSWATVGGQWPMVVNLTNNDVTWGRNVSAIGDVIAFASDRRLKENFEPIASPLEKVLKLNGCTFDWKSKVKELGFYPTREKNEIGLIAQDVQAVIPQAVAPAPFDQEWDNEEGKNVSKSGEDYLTVKYEKLVPLLIEAIKEQQSQIEALTERVNQLENN